MIFALEGAVEFRVEDPLSGIEGILAGDSELLGKRVKESYVAAGDVARALVVESVDPTGELCASEIVYVDSDLGGVVGGDDL